MIVKKRKFVTQHLVLDMVPCSHCGTWFEALPGENLCTSCSQSAEVESLVRRYRLDNPGDSDRLLDISV